MAPPSGCSSPALARRSAGAAPMVDPPPRPPAAKPFSSSRTTTWCVRYVERRTEGARLSRHRDAQRARGTRHPARAGENRSAVHRCRDARRHVRAPSLPRKPSRLRPGLKILLTSGHSRTSGQATDGSGRDVHDPEQALPPARSGVDAAVGAECRLSRTGSVGPLCRQRRDDPPVEMPGGVAEHRQRHHEAEEVRHRRDRQQDHDDAPPSRSSAAGLSPPRARW